MPDMKLAHILLRDGNRASIPIGHLLLNPLPDDLTVRCSSIDRLPNVLVAWRGQVVSTTLDVDSATIEQSYPAGVSPDLLVAGRHAFLNVMRILVQIADESVEEGANVLQEGTEWRRGLVQ